MSSETEQTLEEILEMPDITMPEMFQIPNIFSKIKMRLQLFIDFCLRNEEFMKSMINIGIKVPMHNNQNMKKIAHIALEILTCDHDCISELFIIDKKRQRIRLYSEEEDQICEEIVKDETSGELMIADKKPSGESSFTDKFANLLELMNYTQEKLQNIDENCINYLTKVLNTIVRVKPAQLYLFFQQQPKYIHFLIQLTCFPSICTFLAKLLTELQTVQYRIPKQQILQQYISALQKSINSDQFQNRLQLVEELFNKNKFRNQEQDQLKIITQPLVNSNTINWFLERWKTGTSSILYLLTVVRRMNIDEEKDPYSYYEENNTEPTMNFEVKDLYEAFPTLIEHLTQVDNLSNLNLLNFYELLHQMTKHSTFSKYTELLSYRSICFLLKQYINCKQKSKNGLILFNIVALIQKILIELKKTAKNILQSEKQQLQKQIRTLQSQKSSLEVKSYDNKIKVLLEVEGSDWDEINQYTTALSPNNFTQKKTHKVNQFEFLNQLPHTKKEEKMEPEKIEEKKTIHLPKLEDKIKKMKERKVKVNGNEEQSKSQQNKEEDKSLTPSQIEFYSRHLIIF